MEYLVAVFRDRIQAEAAYTELEKAGLPAENCRIFGAGYKGANDFDLVDPNENAKNRAYKMMTWLVPFGFFGGVAFNTITGLQTFPWAGVTGNQIIGGFLGSIGGAMGGLFASGGFGSVLEIGDSKTYRTRLQKGQYLVTVTGSRFQLSDATTILRRSRPENLQVLFKEEAR